MRASDVTLKPVTWLEFPFVPLGKITAVAGQMGQAKSLWTCWLAGKVTNNGGRVIAMNAEDDAEDTIVPRLKAAGAELGRVWIDPKCHSTPTGWTRSATRWAPCGSSRSTRSPRTFRAT
jgi:hypothetical protein